LYFLREGRSLQGVGWVERKRENSASTGGGGVVHHIDFNHNGFQFNIVNCY